MGVSNSVTFTLDTVPPAPPSLALAHDTGASSSDRITSDPRIAYTLSAAGDTLLYSLDGGSFTTTAPVLATDGSADGRHTVSAEEKDAAGNVSGSASLSFTLDTTAPHVAITSVGGNVTTAQQTITGMVDVADAGSTVTLKQNGSFAGNAVVQANGSWSAQVTLGASGTDTIVAIDTDIAGNVGTSNAVAFTLGSPPQQNLFGEVTHDVTSSVGDIYALYETILGRAPDAAGFSADVAALQSGEPLVDIAWSLLASTEYATRFGAYTQGSDTAFVDQLYENSFNRAPDAAGLAGWDQALASGHSRAEIALGIALSSEHQSDIAPVFQAHGGVYVASQSAIEIAQLYYGVFDRAPDAGGLAGWENAFAHGQSAELDRVRFPRLARRVAFTGGVEFNDHRLIWDRLDKVHARHPDMVLMHGGSPKGAKRIAARWADHRKVCQIVFRPDWTKHAKAAPFKRNNAMLEALPIGVVVCPGTGIQENLVDKARKLGIPVMRVGSGRA
jgi:hypothetical protein